MLLPFASLIISPSLPLLRPLKLCLRVESNWGGVRGGDVDDGVS